MTALVIGVDPGGTTGVFWFQLPPADVAEEYRRAGVYPASGAVQMHGADGVLPYVERRIAQRTPGERVVLAVEDFVVGGRAGRSRTGQGGKTARNLIGSLSELYSDTVSVVLRPAGAVKPWATDHRLGDAGLLTLTQSLPHARDAARHALYAAVKAGLMPDPLSPAAIAFDQPIVLFET